ncbi:MAG: phosphonopyruvate decarboxylase [bacterium]
MVNADDFLQLCKQHQYDLFSGTPCSYLKPLINAVIDDPEIQYLPATNEGDAVAMICGASLKNRKGVVMFQNSGLGNAVNPLTSLSFPFRFPFIMIVTHRGQPGGPADEPQHELMGKVTEEMLDTLKIGWEHFPDDVPQLQAAFQRALDYIGKTDLPYAFVLRKGTIEAQELKSPPPELPLGKRSFSFSETIGKRYEERLTRTEALREILAFKHPDDILVATTGKTGRELYALGDTPDQLYMVGSMGCASSFALGAAICSPERRWVVIDGDAAALMRLGNLASVGHFQPSNYLHILLDNEINDSTGGQSTVSPNVSFSAVAQACGYGQVFAADCAEALASILQKLERNSGPVLIHFRIRKGSPKDLGRPGIKPYEVKQRLMNHLAAGQPTDRRGRE